VAKYWWQCDRCSEKPAWLTVCNSRSVAAFIWDELLPSGWDQHLLCRKCKCKGGKIRITYRFKSGDPERVSIKHIVGLTPVDQHLPMLWETFHHSNPKTKLVDFKYQRGRSPWGLKKHLVMKKSQLTSLLRKYGRVD